MPPKKRGKKIINESDDNPSIRLDDDNNSLEQYINDKISKAPKKRGRKPKNILFQKGNRKIKAIKEDEEQVILHLPITQHDLGEEQDTKSNSSSENIDAGKIEIDELTDIEEQEDSKNNDLVDDNPDCKHCRLKDKKIQELTSMTDNVNVEMETKFTKMNMEIYDHSSRKKLNRKKLKDLSCWWCTCAINNILIGLPEHKRQGKYHTIGFFCSPNCAMAYNDAKKDFNVSERATLLIEYCSIMFGKQFNKIKPAPPKECLKKYGGILDETEYRKLLFTNKRNLKIIYPPLSPIIPVIEDQHVVTTEVTPLSKKTKRTTGIKSFGFNDSSNRAHGTNSTDPITNMLQPRKRNRRIK